MKAKPELKLVLTEQPSLKDCLDYYSYEDSCENCNKLNLFYIRKGTTVKAAKRAGLMNCYNCGCQI